MQVRCVCQGHVSCRSVVIVPCLLDELDETHVRACRLVVDLSIVQIGVGSQPTHSAPLSGSLCSSLSMSQSGGCGAGPAQGCEHAGMHKQTYCLNMSAGMCAHGLLLVM